MVHCVNELLHALVVPQPGAHNASAPQPLDRKSVRVHPLDVSLATVDNDAWVVGNDVNLLELELGVLHDLSLPVAAELVGDLHTLLQDQVVDHILTAEKFVYLSNPLDQHRLLLQELAFFDGRQATQRHAKETLDLLGTQVEPVLQRRPHLGQVDTVLNYLNDII